MFNIETLKFELPHHQEILLYYKANHCNLNHQNPANNQLVPGQSGDPKFCFGYHNPRERRRPIQNSGSSNPTYQPMKCFAFFEKGVCTKGDSCKFSHTQAEIDYHPLYYKTEACRGCSYENNPKFCPFYHNDEGSRQAAIEKLKTKNNKNTVKTQPNNFVPGQAPFDLETFKSAPCFYKGNHNPKVCEYFHHDKDRKRPVEVYHYSSNLCPYTEKGQTCPNGDNCDGCHNKVEQLYHPERYKRKFCLLHPHNIQKCEYGDYCSFAHNENEIKIELLHNLKKDESFYLYKFKTVYCPYIYEHDRNQCVYAHNPQDLRRDPSKINYKPSQCPMWSQRQIFSYEEGGCPKQMLCENCHGWKEMEYHPLYYKTKPCNNGKKCNKKDCPFFHSNNEKREPQQQQQQIIQSQSSNIQIPIQPTTTGTGTGKSQQPLNKAPTNVETNILLDESLKAKFNINVKKDSHYQRPIIPTYNNNNATTTSIKEKEQSLKPASLSTEAQSSKVNAESSTRPNSNNSNVSSIYFTVEEENNQNGAKKKKTKRMSLQGKKERLASPFSAKSDKPKAQINKETFQTPKVNIWKYNANNNTDNNKQEGFEEYFNVFETSKPLNESRTNESFESLQSYTIEKNGGTAEKCFDISSSRFGQNLFSNLERRGLDYLIPHIKNSSLDLESFKNFSQKDFAMLPHLGFEEKEKLVKIIHDIIEEEAILLEINSINEGHFSNFINSHIEDNNLYEIFSSYDNSSDPTFHNLFSNCS